MDKYNFLLWVRTFVEYTRDLRSDRRKILLVYDAYKFHISLEVLGVFKRYGIIIYALPAYTPGKHSPWMSYCSLYLKILLMMLSETVQGSLARENLISSICVISWKKLTKWHLIEQISSPVSDVQVYSLLTPPSCSVRSVHHTEHVVLCF